MANPTLEKFEDLSDAGKAAVTPAGEYKDPALLDQGNGFEGAPTGEKKPTKKASTSDPSDEKQKTTRRSS